MSNTNMLEQAFIDAESLKETALKNAESIILEKYSNEVKKAVDNINGPISKAILNFTRIPITITEINTSIILDICYACICRAEFYAHWC